MNDYPLGAGGAGCRTDTACPERPQTQVSAYIKELNNNLTALDVALSQHINAIAPVLNDAKPTTQEEKKEVAERICPVAHQLRSINARIIAIRQRLETTTSLVQA